MADQAFRDMAFLVRPHAPGVPDVQLYYALVEATREHLARALAWQYDIGVNVGALDLADDTAWPTITAGTHIPTDTYVVQPMKLKWDDGQEITFLTRAQLDDIDGDWEQDSSGSKPCHWTTLQPGSHSVYPKLATATTAQLYMRVAIAPQIHKATGAAGIDEFLAYEYRQAWARGALRNLLMIPGKDWSDAARGQLYASEFEDDIKVAKSRVAADYGRPDRTVAYGGLSIGGAGSSRANDYGKNYRS